MSGSLKRAFGIWVASQVADLHVYANDLANSGHKYPSCTVTELQNDLSPAGCGKRDFKVRDDETGYVTESGRLLQSAVAYRLTVQAPSDADSNGQEQVDSILDAIESAVLAVGMDWGQFVLEDTGTDPDTSFPIGKISVAGRQSIPADVSGEPFLYRGTLTVSLARLVPMEKTVEHVMERINVESEGG